MSSSDRSLKLIASQARPSLFRMNNAPIQPGTGAVGWVTQGATPTGNNLPIRWKCAALAAHSFVQAHLRFGHNRSTLGWTNRPPRKGGPCGARWDGDSRPSRFRSGRPSENGACSGPANGTTLENGVWATAVNEIHGIGRPLPVID